MRTSSGTPEVGSTAVALSPARVVGAPLAGGVVAGAAVSLLVSLALGVDAEAGVGAVLTTAGLVSCAAAASVLATAWLAGGLRRSAGSLAFVVLAGSLVRAMALVALGVGMHYALAPLMIPFWIGLVGAGIGAKVCELAMILPVLSPSGAKAAA